MRVSRLSRKCRAGGGNDSVELIVAGVVRELQGEFRLSVAESRYESTGVWARLYNIVEAALRQGDVTHVTGDVHYLVYLLRKRRTLLTVLDCGRIEGSQVLRTRLIKLLWFTLPTKRCAAVTVISEDVKRQLLRHVAIDPDKVHVVPVAVPAHYRRIDRPFNHHKPRILQIGVTPNKNRARLFAALAGLSCSLDLVGKLSPEERGLLEQFGLEYEVFHNLTNEQMLERYAACDLLAFASTFEGFGMPIVEANLVGRPVVAGNVASMPEVAADAACLVDPFSVESIRAGVVRVIEDAAYREQLVKNGYRNALRFNEPAVARRYAALYRSLGAR